MKRPRRLTRVFRGQRTDDGCAEAPTCRAVLFRLAQRHGSADEAIVAADKVVAIVPEGSRGCIIRTVGEPLFVAATVSEAAAALGFEVKDLRATGAGSSAGATASLISRLRSRSSQRA